MGEAHFFSFLNETTEDTSDSINVHTMASNTEREDAERKEEAIRDREREKTMREKKSVHSESLSSLLTLMSGMRSISPLHCKFY